MASVQRDKKTGRALVQFVGLDKRRHKIRLGTMSQKNADTFGRHLEEMLGALKHNLPIEKEVAAWANALPDELAAKMAELGLMTKREATTLGPFLDAYKELRADVKGATAIVYGHTIRNLKTFFGENRQLSSITEGDADEFRLKLLAAKPTGEGLAENTVRRRCTLASQFFRAAMRKKIIGSNPFEGVGGTVKSNKDRVYFLTREDADKILAACPSNRWRLIFSLSRFGGLRTPSEHNGLKWNDVDLPGGRFLVHSPKTEHHEGGAERWVPIFPELRPYLEQAWDDVQPGEEFVISRRGDKIALRTEFERIIKRAGLKPWPKLFQNLRSTRQTELTAEHPIHVVCAWLGNKAAIAAEHYLQVTDADFEKASAGANLGQSGRVSTVPGGSLGEVPRKMTRLEPQGTLLTVNLPLSKWATQDSNL